MKLTWHIVMKDLRRLRWALGLLFALTVAKIGIGVLALRGSAFAWSFVMGGSLIVLLELLIRYVLVAAFLQDDSLVEVGTDWQTRPISGWQLLGAKLIGLTLTLVLMPLVVLVPWWLHCDFGGSDIAFALSEHLLWQGTVLLIGLPLAAHTKGYARFFVRSVVLLLTVSVTSLIGSGASDGVSLDLVKTRIWIGVGLAMATAIAVTLNQFLTRATRRGLFIFAGGMFGAIAMAWIWPWSLLKYHLALGPPYGTEIVLTPGKLEINESTGANVTGRQTYAIRGLREDVVLEGGFVKQVYRWPDGSTFAPLGPITASPDDLRRLLWKKPPEKAADYAFVTTFGAIPEAHAKRLRTATTVLSGLAQLQMRRVVSRGEQSLEVGDTWSDGAKTRWISQIEKENDGVVATLLGHEPARGNSAQALGMMVTTSMPPDNYWLVDREKGKFLATKSVRREELRIGSVRICRSEIKFIANDAGVDGSTFGENLRRLKLVRVDYESEMIKIPVKAAAVGSVP